MKYRTTSGSGSKAHDNEYDYRGKIEDIQDDHDKDKILKTVSHILDSIGACKKKIKDMLLEL